MLLFHVWEASTFIYLPTNTQLSKTFIERDVFPPIALYFQLGQRQLTFAVASDMIGFILCILLCIDYISFPSYSLKSLFWFC